MCLARMQSVNRLSGSWPGSKKMQDVNELSGSWTGLRRMQDVNGLSEPQAGSSGTWVGGMAYDAGGCCVDGWCLPYSRPLVV